MTGEASALVSAAEQAVREIGEAHLKLSKCKEGPASCSCSLGAAWFRLHHALLDYKDAAAKTRERLGRRFR